jgi:hypothetical protein
MRKPLRPANRRYVTSQILGWLATICDSLKRWQKRALIKLMPFSLRLNYRLLNKAAHSSAWSRLWCGKVTASTVDKAIRGKREGSNLKTFDILGPSVVPDVMRCCVLRERFKAHSSRGGR